LNKLDLNLGTEYRKNLQLRIRIRYYIINIGLANFF
jgi:hypothetical protein